jgi:hypothetical protein
MLLLLRLAKKAILSRKRGSAREKSAELAYESDGLKRRELDCGGQGLNRVHTTDFTQREGREEEGDDREDTPRKWRTAIRYDWKNKNKIENDWNAKKLDSTLDELKWSDCDRNRRIQSEARKNVLVNESGQKERKRERERDQERTECWMVIN